MKVGQKTYNRGLGRGEITKITEQHYYVQYDKILVEYEHKDISKALAIVCLTITSLFFSAVIYFNCR